MADFLEAVLLLYLQNEAEELVVASLVLLLLYITSSILLYSKLFDDKDWNIGLLRFSNSLYTNGVIAIGEVHILEYVMIWLKLGKDIPLSYRLIQLFS